MHLLQHVLQKVLQQAPQQARVASSTTTTCCSAAVLLLCSIMLGWSVLHLALPPVHVALQCVAAHYVAVCCNTLRCSAL